MQKLAAGVLLATVLFWPRAQGTNDWEAYEGVTGSESIGAAAARAHRHPEERYSCELLRQLFPVAYRKLCL